MAIVAGFANQTRLDLLNYMAGHNLKIALYLQASSNMDLNTPTYTTVGEITGAGYTAGGTSLTGKVVSLVGNTAIMVCDNPFWAGATFSADACMIYDADNANHAVGFFDYTLTTKAGQTFTLTMDANGVLKAA